MRRDPRNRKHDAAALKTRAARLGLWSVWLCAWLAATTSASAQAPTPLTPPAKPASSDYKSLIDKGLEAYAEQRHSEARALFAQAHALAPSARTLRALGIADLALDNFTLAREELEAALAHRSAPLTQEQRREVNELLAWMRANLGTLHLRCTPVQAEAKIDGRPVRLPEVLLEPHEHHLTISAQGFVPHERTFKLSLDKPLTLEVALSPQPTPRQPPPTESGPTPIAEAPAPVTTPDTAASAAVDAQPASDGGDGPKLWPWIGGAGAVLLAAGGTMFALGLSDKAKVENAERGVRLSELESAHDRVPWLTGTGIALGAVGLAGIGVATALLITQPERRSELAWSVDAGLGRISFARRF